MQKKRPKLTRKDRLVKAARNERRGRVSKVVKWEKEHVVKDKPVIRGKAPTKAARAEKAVREMLRKLPDVEDVQ